MKKFCSECGNKLKQAEVYPVNIGDEVKDYSGNVYDVIDVSVDLDSLLKYDSTGAWREFLDTENYGEGIGYSTIGVAVYDYDDDDVTYVFTYGDGGVTKLDKGENDHSLNPHPEESDDGW